MKMTSKEALEELKMHDWDSEMFAELYDAIKNDLLILEAIKKSHVKDDVNTQSISVWYSNKNDFYKMVRWINEQK